jgi:hypothetical protein
LRRSKANHLAGKGRSFAREPEGAPGWLLQQRMVDGVIRPNTHGAGTEPGKTAAGLL